MFTFSIDVGCCTCHWKIFIFNFQKFLENSFIFLSLSILVKIKSLYGRILIIIFLRVCFLGN